MGSQSAQLGRVRAGANRSVQSAIRFRRLRALSAEGVTIHDAAQSLNMSVQGVRGLLAREMGTSIWPVAVQK